VARQAGMREEPAGDRIREFRQLLLQTAQQPIECRSSGVSLKARKFQRIRKPNRITQRDRQSLFGAEESAGRIPRQFRHVRLDGGQLMGDRSWIRVVDHEQIEHGSNLHV
jgi:hypothetical protein